MSSPDAIAESAIPPAAAAALALRLEVVVLPVADVDRAKAFYTGLDWPGAVKP